MLTIKRLLLFSLSVPGIIILLLIANIFTSLKSSVSRRTKVIFALISVFICYLATTSFISKPALHKMEKSYVQNKVIVGIDAVAVLTGGIMHGDFTDPVSKLSNSTIKRLNTAYGIYNKIKKPVIILGGVTFKQEPAESQVAKELLIFFNVPKEKIITDTVSINTFENIKELKKIMAERKFKKVLIVTSAGHIQRVKDLTDKLNIVAEFYPADYKTSGRLELSDFLPSLGNSNYNFCFLYEFLANIKYYMYTR